MNEQERYHYAQYGLTPAEIEMLEKCNRQCLTCWMDGVCGIQDKMKKNEGSDN